MLDAVRAIRFDRRTTAGRTQPCLVAATRVESGAEVEAFAKFSANCDRQNGNLVAEAIAAFLARDLDLPVPEPLLVEFDEDFVTAVRDHDYVLAGQMHESSRAAFGSRKLPPSFSAWPAGKTIPRHLRQQASEIFAFDMLIQNADRRRERPNCLSNGESFAIIDHEMAFLIDGIIGWRPPWNVGSLAGVSQGHLFYAELRGRELHLERLLGAWQAVNAHRLAEYAAALPPIWTDADNGVTTSSLVYLAQLVENIEPALDEVARVLA